mmetsp:Transcript_40986/g.88059  ORF Transcript_40986/g.88059 Transcript_40986/m.88059 type:complete len:185 (-) Transcript_40986:334-888(-)
MSAPDEDVDGVFTFSSRISKDGGVSDDDKEDEDDEEDNDEDDDEDGVGEENAEDEEEEAAGDEEEEEEEAAEDASSEAQGGGEEDDDDEAACDESCAFPARSSSLSFSEKGREIGPGHACAVCVSSTMDPSFALRDSLMKNARPTVKEPLIHESEAPLKRPCARPSAFTMVLTASNVELYSLNS